MNRPKQIKTQEKTFISQMKYNNNLICVDRFENLMTAKEGRIKTLRRKQKSRTYPKRRNKH